MGRTYNRSNSAWCWMILFLLLSSPLTVQAQSELFKDADKATVDRVKAEREKNLGGTKMNKRIRIATFDAKLLEQKSLVLNVFDDKKLKIKQDKLVEFEIEKGWFGTIDGDQYSSVAIFFNGTWISGRIKYLNNLYLLNSDENGVVTIADVDGSMLLPETDVITDK